MAVEISDIERHNSRTKFLETDEGNQPDCQRKYTQ